MHAYRGALVNAWGTLHDRNRRPFENMPDVDPRGRLAVTMQTLVAPRHWALERAMRVWALTDNAALTSVQQSDGRVLRAVRQAFIDYGCDPEDANLRSFVVFASGVGLMHASGSTPETPPELLDRFLDFMLRP